MFMVIIITTIYHLIIIIAITTTTAAITRLICYGIIIITRTVRIKYILK
jgi:hypothetical protein